MRKRIAGLSLLSAALLLLGSCERPMPASAPPAAGSTAASAGGSAAPSTPAVTPSPGASPTAAETSLPSLPPLIPTVSPVATPASTAGPTKLSPTPPPASQPGPLPSPAPVEPTPAIESPQTELSKPSPDSKLSWDVQLGTHAFKVTATIDNQKTLQVEAIEAGQRALLSLESFGASATLDVTPLENGAGQRTLLLEASSGGAGADIRSAVLALDARSGQPTLKPEPFQALNATRLADLVPQIRDEVLKKWVVDRYMGFRTARFQSFAGGAKAGTVLYTIGSQPVLVAGKADVQYDFDKQQFVLTGITSAMFEDALSSSSCSNIVQAKDPQFGDILAWSDTQNPASYRFAAINPAYLAQAAACGESLDKPLKNGSYYLIETILRYNDKPELLKSMLENWKPNVRIQDRGGRSAYTIALAAGVKEPELLARLREGLTPAQAQAEEQAVKLALHGSRLKLDEVQQLIKGGLSVNTDLSDYAYLLQEEDPDHSSGTILGSAILNGDEERVKWLLENGADPNLAFGSGENKRSPLRAALALKSSPKIAELLLQNKAAPDEVYEAYPQQLSLLAGNRCSPDKVALLKKYGAVKWLMVDPDPALRIDYRTEEEIMKQPCK